MKKILLVFLLLPILTWGENRTVQFYKGSLTSAKEKASVEGKLYFVDFVANYCYMCKMMDETTFRDERVIDYIGGNYIPVKVNVDDFDGYVWRQKYKIKVLPTIMVFNSNGEILARYEESMGGTKLLSILTEYNKPENRRKILSNQTTAPPLPVATNSKEKIRTVTPGNIAIPIKKNTIPEGEGLFEFSVKKKKANGFGIQVGVFQDYANVLQEVAALDAKFDVPIFVHITKLNDKLAYRVLVGAFSSRKDAENYHETQMKVKGISGFVKDFTPLL